MVLGQAGRIMLLHHAAGEGDELKVRLALSVTGSRPVLMGWGTGGGG
jgi:hypothetical protein